MKRSVPCFAVLLFALLASDAAAQPASDNENLNLSPDQIQANLVKILRTSNKAQTNRYVPKVYTFKNTNPYAVMRFVRRVIEIEESAWFAFANPEMNGGKLLVSVPAYQLEGLDLLMELLDRRGLTTSAGGKEVFHRLRHRDSLDPGLLDVLEALGTPEAEIVTDPHNNSLLFKDSPSGAERMGAALAEYLDQPTPQLEAHIRVYEIDLTDDGQLGLDYASWKNGPGRNLGAAGLFAQKEKISTLDQPPALLFHSGTNTQHLNGRTFESSGRNGAIFYDLPSAYFDFLVSKGQARIITQTKLVVIDRSTALLEVGERIRYYKVHHNPDLRAGSRLLPLDPYGDLEALVDTPEPDETTDDLGVRRADHPDNRTVVPALQERMLGEVKTGLFIQLRPVIDSIGCDVTFAMSIVNHTGYRDDGAPTLASRQANQVFKIPHDGREITLGGMVRKRRIDSASKIPWLGDIPVLGYLFGGESRLDQRTMVIATFSCRPLGLGEDTTSDEELGTQGCVERQGEEKNAANARGLLDN